MLIDGTFSVCLNLRKERDTETRRRSSKMLSLSHGLVSLLCLVGGVSAMIQYHEEKTVSTCFYSPFSNNNTMTEACSKALKVMLAETGRRLNFTADEMNYIWSLEREMQGMFHSPRRVRRQTGGSFPLLVRRECRLLRDWERMDLFYAIRTLKFNTNNPNAYNTLADLHRGMTVDTHAHRGSNFLGWHRVYLVFYEIALRRIRGDVAMCFWDTTMEYRLGHTQWTQTAVFSSNFFGNRNGQVITGPFANWPMPPGLTSLGPYLTRQVGVRGMPVDFRAAASIFYSPNTLSHTQVTVGGSGFETITNSNGETRPITIEGEHNNVHNFVGRAMRFTDSATQDPVFFFHHCYIDYMWERFRHKMYQYGRDPTTDYPAHGDTTLHAANYNMIGLPGYRNIDGYSDRFTKEIYTYETPTCHACYNAQYTVCDQDNECMARMNYPGTEIVDGPWYPGTEPDSPDMAAFDAQAAVSSAVSTAGSAAGAAFGSATAVRTSMGRQFDLTSSIE